ncbi:MAG: methyltransferase domain-containing protein [Gemmatimonadaceae bacterium]|nr:methyltransferase domain-containing protein [Gemmatimonadaceae bacterium]
MLTPRRHLGPEILDQRDLPLQLRTRSHRDIAMANRLFGGTRALLAALGECAHALPRAASFLDIGTGTGEATAHARHFGEAHGIAMHTIALDLDASLARAARRHADEGVCASALQLPMADRSIDIVSCHQVAHHFEGAALARLLGEMHRVARCRVIVSDLRRSWIAAGGLWVASFALGFHPVSRHDGVVSVLRGFTVPELESVVYDSCGVRPEVRRRPGFRLTASWAPTA